MLSNVANRLEVIPKQSCCFLKFKYLTDFKGYLWIVSANYN